MTAAERHRRAPPRGHAATLMLGAARIEAEAADDGRINPMADECRERASALIPVDLIARGVGGELVPTDSCTGAAEWRLLNTVENPSYVTADASRARLDLAQEAGALEEALDAADTIQARDSLERMLAHQLATAHVSAMKLSAEMKKQVDHALATRGPGENERAILNATRLAGAVGRMMGTYQQGLLTLQRLRTGGRQTVVVQHVQVNDGGQAVVAGKLATGKGRGRGRRHGGGSTSK